MVNFCFVEKRKSWDSGREDPRRSFCTDGTGVYPSDVHFPIDFRWVEAGYRQRGVCRIFHEKITEEIYERVK